MFGSVEDSIGGCTNRNCYYDGLFWVYIMDRQGAHRLVLRGRRQQRRDGVPAHRARRRIHLDRKARTGTRGVVKMTLDRQYMQTIALADRPTPSTSPTTAPALRHEQRAARADPGGDHPHDLELPDRLRRQLQLLLEHDQLEPGRQHRADVVPGAEHRRADQPRDRRAGRDLRRPRRAATRSRRRPGRSSSSTSRTSRRRGR